MRVWNIPYKYLARQHLLGQHREIHQGLDCLYYKTRFKYHPALVPFRGRELALLVAHELCANEFKERGYTDRTPIADYFKWYFINPQNEWPRCGYSSIYKDLYDIVDKWENWKKRDNKDYRNSGRLPLFPKGESFYEVRNRLEWESKLVYEDALARMMEKYKDQIEFAGFDKPVEVETLFKIKTVSDDLYIPKGTITKLWIDSRTRKRSPGVTENLRIVVYPGEYKILGDAK